MQPGIDSSDYEKYVTGFREVQATGYSGGFSGCFEPPTEDEFNDWVNIRLSCMTPRNWPSNVRCCH